jgi:uncharacterized integral membrane protein (TIGR00698 family)
MKNVLRAIIALLFVICLIPFVQPAWALATGLIIGIVWGNPWSNITTRWSGKLLQWSVVGLGFGLSLDAALASGREGFVYTIVSLAFVFALGWMLNKVLRCDGQVGLLVTVGTAICGGSAIAAVSPAIRSSASDTSLALVVVFILNAVGLVLFPWLGGLLGMDAETFGTWAALAIHDTSSVVGAATAYDDYLGTDATLEVATTVKLTRALWIIPIALLAGMLTKGQSGGKVKFPYFILGFVAAIVITHFVPAGAPIWEGIQFAARRLLVAVLFLIGLGLTREKLQSVGWKPLVFGVGLWMATTLFTYFLV